MKKKNVAHQQSESMSIIAQSVFWCFLIVCGLFVQFFISGVDILVVGLLLVLQGRSVLPVIIIFFILMVLQEATGVMPFGMILLEYCLVILAFFIGRGIFAVGTSAFVFLLSLFIAVTRYVLVYLFSAIQGIGVEHSVVLFQSMIQFIVVPIVWYPMYIVYKRFVQRGNTV